MDITKANLLTACKLAHIALRTLSDEAGDVAIFNEGGEGYIACAALREAIKAAETPRETRDVYNVEFDYHDEGHFSELVSMTFAEWVEVKAALHKACEEGTIEQSWYCDKPQTQPSTFNDFMPRLLEAIGVED